MKKGLRLSHKDQSINASWTCLGRTSITTILSLAGARAVARLYRAWVGMPTNVTPSLSAYSATLPSTPWIWRAKWSNSVPVHCSLPYSLVDFIPVFPIKCKEEKEWWKWTEAGIPYHSSSWSGQLTWPHVRSTLLKVEDEDHSRRHSEMNTMEMWLHLQFEHIVWEVSFGTLKTKRCTSTNWSMRYLLRR